MLSVDKVCIHKVSSSIPCYGVCNFLRIFNHVKNVVDVWVDNPTSYHDQSHTSVPLSSLVGFFSFMIELKEKVLNILCLKYFNTYCMVTIQIYNRWIQRAYKVSELIFRNLNG